MYFISGSLNHIIDHSCSCVGVLLYETGCGAVLYLEGVQEPFGSHFLMSI